MKVEASVAALLFWEKLKLGAFSFDLIGCKDTEFKAATLGTGYYAS